MFPLLSLALSLWSAAVYFTPCHHVTVSPTDTLHQSGCCTETAAVCRSGLSWLKGAAGSGLPAQHSGRSRDVHVHKVLALRGERHGRGCWLADQAAALHASCCSFPLLCRQDSGQGWCTTPPRARSQTQTRGPPPRACKQKEWRLMVRHGFRLPLPTHHCRPLALHVPRKTAATTQVRSTMFAPGPAEPLVQRLLDHLGALLCVCWVPLPAPRRQQGQAGAGGF